jgi:hypothetical protein
VIACFCSRKQDGIKVIHRFVGILENTTLFPQRRLWKVSKCELSPTNIPDLPLRASPIAPKGDEKKMSDSRHKINWIATDLILQCDHMARVPCRLWRNFDLAQFPHVHAKALFGAGIFQDQIASFFGTMLRLSKSPRLTSH